MINNHLNLPKKIVFDTGEINYLYDATGVKLKKTVIDDNTSQTTNTHYLGGFQYTEDQLDFFHHAEGYVNVIDFSEFHYIYTYKDHLGNIRLKYTQDPGTGETEILEENHYYPFGLTHKGYNGEHRFFFQTPGTGIQLVPVTPLAGDKHKYKFGGMEWQDELALNHYDFGARNYDPALGRWMNIDPLAEMMRRHSPYNYTFDNPVYFIDPDGMAPIPSGSSLLVSDTKYLGTSDIMNGNMGSTNIGNSFGGEDGKSGGGKNDGKGDNSAETPDLPSSNSEENIVDQIDTDINENDGAQNGGCEDCPSPKDYRNRDIINHNGKSYILYDNKWLQIENLEEYNTRIEQSRSSRRPPMPRGGREIDQYMKRKALPNMAEGVITGSGGGIMTDIIRNLKPSLPAAIIGALLNGTYNGYKTYYETSKSMETHDIKVKK